MGSAAALLPLLLAHNWRGLAPPCLRHCVKPRLAEKVLEMGQRQDAAAAKLGRLAAVATIGDGPLRLQVACRQCAPVQCLFREPQSMEAPEPYRGEWPKGFPRSHRPVYWSSPASDRGPSPALVAAAWRHRPPLTLRSQSQGHQLLEGICHSGGGPLGLRAGNSVHRHLPIANGRSPLAAKPLPAGGAGWSFKVLASSG
jgi:hypothetical protein